MKHVVHMVCRKCAHVKEICPPHEGNMEVITENVGFYICLYKSLQFSVVDYQEKYLSSNRNPETSSIM